MLGDCWLLSAMSVLASGKEGTNRVRQVIVHAVCPPPPAHSRRVCVPAWVPLTLALRRYVVGGGTGPEQGVLRHQAVPSCHRVVAPLRCR